MKTLKVIGIVVILFFGLYATLHVVFSLSGGRLGIVRIVGNSAPYDHPYGSSVLVFPLQPTSGDFVCAWAPEGLSSNEDEVDLTPGYVIKIFHKQGEPLTSGNGSSRVYAYEIRSRVLVSLPTHLIVPWWNKGVQNQPDQYNETTVEEATQAKSDFLDREVNRLHWIEKYTLVRVESAVKRSKTAGNVIFEITFDKALVFEVSFVMDIGAEGLLLAEVSSDGVTWQKTATGFGGQFCWQGPPRTKLDITVPKTIKAIRLTVMHPDVDLALDHLQILVQHNQHVPT